MDANEHEWQRGTELIIRIVLCCRFLVVFEVVELQVAKEKCMKALTKDEVEGIKNHLLSLSREDGGFDASPLKGYRGIADSRVSDLAATVYVAEIGLTMGFELPEEKKTIEYIQARQRPEGNFHPIEDYGFDAASQKELSFYNTCMGLRGLKVFNKYPKYDPKPFLEKIVREDFKIGKFSPPYAPDMVANAYAAIDEEMPKDCEGKLGEFLLRYQEEKTGWILQKKLSEEFGNTWSYPFERNNPMTFHAARFFHLVGKEIPMAEKILETFMKVQEDDGSWKLGNVHGTFDAIVTLRMLSDNSEKYKNAIKRGAEWALSCQRPGGGFNHFGNNKPPATNQPDKSWSDSHPAEEQFPPEVDACYFHIATLVMAGMIPTKLNSKNRWIGWGHTLINRSYGHE